MSASLVCPSFATISAAFHTAGQQVYELGVRGFLRGESTWLSRKIVHWSQNTFPHLPHTAKVVSVFLQALPHIILALTLSPYAVFALGVACTMGRIYRPIVGIAEARQHIQEQQMQEAEAQNQRNMELNLEDDPFATAAGLSLLTFGGRDLISALTVPNALIILRGVGFLCSGIKELLPTRFLHHCVFAVGERPHPPEHPEQNRPIEA